MIGFVDVALGAGGGAGCARCHPAQARITYRPVDEIAEEIASVCGSWVGRLGPNVRLTGAEPFGHPELPAIVSAAAAAGCRRIGVDTDAIALRSHSNAGGALMAGVRHVRVTLLGGAAGLHDALAGASGLFESTREGVRSYRAVADAEGTAVSVTALVPICRHNVHELPSAVAAAIECGVDSVLLRLDDEDADTRALAPWVTAACDTGVVNGVWVEVEGVPFCDLPGYDLHVSDAVRARVGSKPPMCASCALDELCAGAPPGASAERLARLVEPPFASRLAPSVARARAGRAN